MAELPRLLGRAKANSKFFGMPIRLHRQHAPENQPEADQVVNAVKVRRLWLVDRRTPRTDATDLYESGCKKYQAC